MKYDEFNLQFEPSLLVMHKMSNELCSWNVLNFRMFTKSKNIFLGHVNIRVQFDHFANIMEMSLLNFL